MTDFESAKVNLEGHSISICKDNIVTMKDEKGIAPMMNFIAEGKNLEGFSVADLIVGKAVAMLFVKAGIVNVYGKVMSNAGKDFLEKNNINFEYETLTDKIINRNGDDICPMEKTVANIDDVEEAYTALKNKIEELKK